jgi:POT family proton-dependent oligopeptide transporter
MSEYECRVPSPSAD